MKIFKISRKTPCEDYDIYLAAIVVAEDAKTARTMSPAEGGDYVNYGAAWCDPKDVKVKYLGEAAFHIDKGVLLASFRAG